LGKIFQALEKSEQSIQKEGIQMDEADSSPYSTKKSSGGKETQNPEILDNENKNGSFNVRHDHLTVDINEALETVLKPHSAASEQFRMLKTNILFPEKREAPRTIMITSPSPGEGKSFIAANLAISIAQSIDEFVLLMDCDLRSPSIHSLFGFNDKTIGLSEYLSSSIMLSSVLQKTFINKLTILPAGSIPPNPSELLSSEQMRRMLHEVKLRYSDRYIMIDTPPPYITSDTNAIARSVDGIIIVVKQGKTRKKEVQDIIDIYGKDKILGVVQNFSQKKLGYGYGYRKYGYGKQ
jgi:protein-tyrosine kinase